MTTGTRLTKYPGWAGLIFSATLWFAIGNACGWYIGNSGGFKRGVLLTANLFISLMETMEPQPSQNFSPRKYTDL